MLSKKVFLIFFFASVVTFEHVVKACYTDAGCDYNEVCCNGYCQDQYNYCSCNFNSDCPDSQWCCDYSCSYDEDCGYLDAGSIAGIVVGSIFFIIVVVIIGLCICGCCCAAGPFRNRARGGGYVRGPTYGTTTTTVVSSTAAGVTNPAYPQNPPYMGHPQYQQPPPGQYPPPPQYGQNYASGYQSFPQQQAPPPYPDDYRGQQSAYAPQPAVNPNV